MTHYGKNSNVDTVANKDYAKLQLSNSELYVPNSTCLTRVLFFSFS